jgi:hypothetical protein
MDHTAMHLTDDTADRLQLEYYRRLTGEQRLLLAYELSMTVRAFAAARLRGEHPDWTERDILRELIRIACLPEPGGQGAG